MVDVQVKPIAACMLDASSKLLSAKRDTALTTILLVSDDLNLWGRCLDEVDRGSARIDEEFILALHAAGNHKVKLALASSSVSSRMKPRSFRRIFNSAYARSDLTVQERRELMWNLERFLLLNPAQARIYERTILKLARSPHVNLSIRGIPMAARFARVDASTLDLSARCHRLIRIPEAGGPDTTDGPE
jgi:hypothetical protein